MSMHGSTDPRPPRRAARWRLVLAAAAFVLPGLAGAAGTVEPGALLERLARGGDGAPVVVDVRTPAEFRAGHVPGAVNLPLGSLARQRAALEGLADREVVLYCETGRRAAAAARALAPLGFRDVRLLEGHMVRWRAEGRPQAR